MKFYDEAVRVKAVKRLLAGETIREVSKSVGCSDSVLSGWKKRLAPSFKDVNVARISPRSKVAEYDTIVASATDLINKLKDFLGHE